MWGGSTRREQKCGAEMRSPQHLPTRSGAAQGWHPSAAVPPCVHSRHTPAAHLEPARTRAWHRRRVAAPAAAAAPCHEAAAGDGLLLARAHGLNFPHSSGLFEFGGQELEADEVVRMLAPMMTTERIARIEGVVRRRTYGVTFVAEHLYDVGNLAAVCRSADAFGFGSVHVIKRRCGRFCVCACARRGCVPACRGGPLSAPRHARAQRRQVQAERAHQRRRGQVAGRAGLGQHAAVHQRHQGARGAVVPAPAPLLFQRAGVRGMRMLCCVVLCRRLACS